MKLRLVSLFFILIGIAVGIILSLQIRAQPISVGSFPLDQLEVQKSLLATFSIEQEELKKQLVVVEEKLSETKSLIEKRSSPSVLAEIASYKELIGLDERRGTGIRITLKDNPVVTRVDFSAINENFVQAADIRDLINALFLQEAQAISLNGKRILPLTSVQSVFDSILVGNFQISSPFVIEAIGDQESLILAMNHVRKRKIQMLIDNPVELVIFPAESTRNLHHILLGT